MQQRSALDSGVDPTGFVVFRMFYKFKSIYSVIATFYYVSIFQASKVVVL